MTFQNEKKTFLAKLDKSRKGNIDEKIIFLIDKINQDENYYTTSSCSGRVTMIKRNGKKNETEWLKVSHDLIDRNFFEINEEGMVWLRLEPLILHVACKDLEYADRLLEKAKKFYKKSCLLSFKNKIIVEVRGSEFIEMPFYNKELLFSGDMEELKDLINDKLELIWEKTEKFKKFI